MGEKVYHEASEVIIELLRMITIDQVEKYLYDTGWTLVANFYTREYGWELRKDLEQPMNLIYAKQAFGQRCLVDVPGKRDYPIYFSTMQNAIERIAIVEETTFVTVICNILGVEQIVLKKATKA